MLINSHMVLYRGCLKSCNYCCSYCPFSKHRGTKQEFEKDKEQWFRFCESLLERAMVLNTHALMLVPYGEALIHSWYWEGLGRLAGTESMEAVGAQTNLSFCIEKSLEIYNHAGGKIEKLRLWATFHPEMVSAEEFAEKCIRIKETGIQLSVGAVGSPENLRVIKALRDRLPEEIYLWINKMDGLRRSYTEAERGAFQAIDPFFLRELTLVRGDHSRCRGRLFVEGNGKLHGCNISPILEENWYGQWKTIFDAPPKCRQKFCSCYLAYGGRKDVINNILFGPYPIFRIPVKPKAVFLDIDGTLIPKGESMIPEYTLTGLKALAAQGQTMLFFATSLPLREAKRQCGKVWTLFRGGVFAGGAHVVLESEQGTREHFSYLDGICLSVLKQQQKRFHYRILVYRAGDHIYKITLARPKHLPWEEPQIRLLAEHCQQNCTTPIRYFAEGRCLELTSAEANKAQGVQRICHWLGISAEDTAAAGDSKEDEQMLDLCGMGYHC